MEPTSQSTEVSAVIERLRARDFDPRLQKIQGSYLFDVIGVGRWRLDIDRGRMQLQEGGATADCVIHAGPTDFVRIARGQQNLITAFMQGAVRIEGDPALAQKLHSLLPDEVAAARGPQ